MQTGKFTKIKQKVREWLNKKRKTIDEGLRSRLMQVSEMENKIKAYYQFVECFIIHTQNIVAQNRLLGQTLKRLYKDSPYEHLIQEVNDALKSGDDMTKRNEEILKNLNQQCGMIMSQIKELKKVVKEREDFRIYYDHYRFKLQGLQQTHAMSNDPKKQEKFIRNQGKFEEAQNNFSYSNNQLEQLLRQINGKAEQVLNSLTIRFTKEIQLKYYQQMQDTWDQLQHIEQQMKEIAHQTGQMNNSQANPSNFGSQLNMNTNNNMNDVFGTSNNNNQQMNTNNMNSNLNSNFNNDFGNTNKNNNNNNNFDFNNNDNDLFSNNNNFGGNNNNQVNRKTFQAPSSNNMGGNNNDFGGDLFGNMNNQNQNNYNTQQQSNNNNNQNHGYNSNFNF